VRDTRRLARALRLPSWVSCVLRVRRRTLMGCNFSLPRAAFAEVNGYDEHFENRVGEDTELGDRLARAGYRLTPLLNRGCVFHLHHPQRSCCPASRRLLALRRAQQPVRCAYGLERPD
jgi:GT2 family glycosyltransferase